MFSAPLRVDFAGGFTDVPKMDLCGTAVLALAIRPQSEKTNLTGMGLGSSGSAAVRRQAQVLKDRGLLHHLNYQTRCEIAEQAWGWEYRHHVCGFQDQYAAALGGLVWLKGVGPSRVSTRLPVPREMRQYITIVLTPPRKESSDNFKGHQNSQVRNALSAMVDAAVHAKRAVIEQNYRELGSAVTEACLAMTRLAHRAASPEQERVIHLATEQGAYGAKPCGAGGGGAVLIIGPRTRFENLFKGEYLPFDIDHDGIVEIQEAH